VLNAAQLEQVQRAGARFAVSPGCTATLAAAARSSWLPFLPGIQTVSEAMALAEQGFQLLKLFPADAAGGVTWLKAVGAPCEPEEIGVSRERFRETFAGVTYMRSRYFGLDLVARMGLEADLSASLFGPGGIWSC
jgi:2-keto-3-deoxy-6-phosphogluconate aldolase